MKEGTFHSSRWTQLIFLNTWGIGPIGLCGLDENRRTQRRPFHPDWNRRRRGDSSSDENFFDVGREDGQTWRCQMKNTRHPWQETLRRAKVHISTHICANWLRHRLLRVQVAKKVIKLHIWVHCRATGNNTINKIIWLLFCFLFWLLNLVRSTRSRKKNN